MKKLIETFREKPWLLVIIGVAIFVTLDIVMLVIASMNPPELIR